MITSVNNRPSVRIRRTPDFIETKRDVGMEKIIAIGDLHGDREMFWGIMLASGCVKMKKLKSKKRTPRWIGKNTIVVCLGDTTDSKRPDVKTDENSNWSKKAEERALQYDILDLDNMAKIKGGRVMSILGNHELFGGVLDSYCKNADIASYGGPKFRKQAFSPGGEMFSLFAETRNVIQIVGPCLFVHGSLVPEFLRMFPSPPRDTMREVNESMRQYLLGKTRMPGWFNKSERLNINPVQSREYSYGLFDKKEVVNMLKEFPGDVRFMFVGHTVHPQITRFGPVICTDVAISRAFGEKQTDIVAEWCEIKGNKVKRCILDKSGWVAKKKLITRKKRKL
jgi:hypothetical protein|tara:strand:+ start:2138 stop:3151 length:1014 start_codon:yes stop_codon:yes gene_type:complete